jgi:redox-sensitive bicupin YhaK (pirin superfamily)
VRRARLDVDAAHDKRGSVTAFEMLIEPRTATVGAGTVRRVLPFRKRRMIGPFIFADLIGPETLGAGDGIDVDAHPHIGLSTLSYLFAGRMVHRDSTGAVSTIEPGAANWMTAGDGVTHTERSHPDDRPTSGPMHGLQTWVALPSDQENGPPSFEHQAAGAIPELDGVRLVAGTGWSMESPVTVSSPLVLAELQPTDTRPISIDAAHRERGVLAIDGELSLGGTPLQSGQLAVLEPGTAPVLSGTGRAMVLGGEPVGKRFIWWNFVHSDRDRIDAAKADWSEQRFPTVPGDHDPWVPLPR